MGAGDLLRRIDERAVPPLGAALDRLIHGPGRLRTPLLVGLGCGVLLLVATVWAVDRDDPRSDRTAGAVVRVGVPLGRSIPGYVSDSRRELAALVSHGPTGEVYALITLSAYLAPDRLAAVVGGLSAAAVYARVPLPWTQTEIVRIDAYRVPEDVLSGMDQVALRKNGEALDYRDLSAKLTGADQQERRLRAAYDNGARVAEAEAEAYRQRCSCVYAVVVRATPASLAKVAVRGEVRAVDPAPQVSSLDRAVFVPPLPEQADSAGAGGDPRPGGSSAGSDRGDSSG